MKWALTVLAILAVVYLIGETLRGRQDTARDSVLTQSAVQKAVDALQAEQAVKDSVRSDSFAREAQRLRRLVQIVRISPLPVAPDTTVRDSLRFFREAYDSASQSLHVALGTLDTLGLAYDAITRALDAQKASSAHFREAYEGERSRADGLTVALRKTGCRKILGLIPYPQLVGGYGATASNGKIGTGPSVTLGWSLGGCGR